MNKGAATISIVLAAILGFIVGNIAATDGSKKGDKETTASVSNDTRGSAAGAERAPGQAEGLGNVGSTGGGGGVAGGDSDKIPVGKSPSIGPADAIVTVVQFSDFQCPFCSKVEPTIRSLRQKYGNDIRIVWKNYPLPFHDNAMPAAEASMAAHAQGKFWEMHAKLFETQQLSRADLERYAQEIGLDVAKFKSDLDGHVYKADIDADMKLADSIGARGTPHFFVNGTRLAGAKPLEAFTDVIDKVLAKARTLPRDKVYAMMVADPVKGPEEEQPAGGQKEIDDSVIMKIPLGDSPASGKADALVTAVVFSDFECPFCARVEPTLAAMRAKYGAELRMVWKNAPLPFHQKAMPAATAAVEIQKQKGDEAFWKFHDTLFNAQQAFMTAMQERQKQMQDNPQNAQQLAQQPMPPSPLERPNLEKIAQDLGCDMVAFRAALDGNVHQARIQQDQQLAQKVGAGGTPHFFINGRRLVGAQPANAFESAIDDAMARAKALVASGTPAAGVYEAIIATAAENAVYKGGGAGAQPAAPPPPPAVRNVPPAPDGPFRGSKDAKIVIEHFSDFQCPYCGMVNPALDQIFKTYGDKVKITWRDFPLEFHENALPAAEAAREVFAQQGNEGFWKFHDVLMAHQTAITRADLEKYAADQQVDMVKFRAALDDHRHQAAVKADQAAGASAGVTGTPATFVNGHSLEGAVPFEQFKSLIDAELAH